MARPVVEMVEPAPQSIVFVRREKRNAEYEGLSDVEKAKIKAAKIEEDALLRYKKRLLAELEADKQRKLLVVYLLLGLSLAVVAGLYYSSEQIGFSLFD